MSAKTKRVERSQRFRRAWRGQNRARAVSPVVATLILILIAVAAAAALYLWLVVWQGNITGGVGSPHAQSTLSIGGSTSVYPFSSLATTWFEQNQSDIAISDNQGGTGAGMIAVCSGNINLGAASVPMTVSLLESDYGCASQYASTIVITTIAYDAVDVVIQSSNTHGLLSMSADTLNVIYEYASSTAPKALIGTINGAAIVPAFTQGTAPAWDQIPAAVAGAAFPGITAGDSPEALDAGIGAGAACTGAGFTSDVCSATGVGGDTPCGWTVCAGTLATGGANIVPISRSDASGTTQTFEAKLLGYGTGATSSATSWAGTQSGATSFAALGYAGCGGNNLLSDCGFTYAAGQEGNGNPGVLGLVAGNANAIGYASDGLARATSGIGIVPFLALGQGVGGAGLPVTSGSTISFGAVVPTTGTSGTIAAGLTASTTVNQYAGGRPFQLVSLEPLTGDAQEFVTFVTDPATNAALAAATDEVGLYSVVP